MTQGVGKAHPVESVGGNKIDGVDFDPLANVQRFSRTEKRRFDG
jgi:hypothetical protein